MKCDDREGQIALYVEGDLGERQQQELVVHLNECLRCRHLETELRDSQSEWKSLAMDSPAPDLEPEFRAHLLSRLGDRSGLGWRWRIERALATRWRPAYALAGLVLLVVSAVGVSRYAWVLPEGHQAVLDSAERGPEVVETQSPPDVAPAAAEIVEPVTSTRVPVSTEPPDRAIVEAVVEPESDEVFVEVATLFERREFPSIDLADLNQDDAKSEVIKWVTDTNVVIYWVMENNEGDGI